MLIWFRFDPNFSQIRHDAMKISAQFSFWAGIVFTLIALAVVTTILVGMEADASEADIAMARGYAMFWLFLAAFGAVMVAVSWLMLTGKLGGDLDD